MKEKHKELQKFAIYWLYKNGCDVFTTECPVGVGISDAVGVRTQTHSTPNITYSIEAKASRSDLICRKQKYCYRTSVEYPDFNYYYLIVADGIKVEDELYPNWGIINENGFVVRRAKKMNCSKDKYIEIIRAIAHVLVYRVHNKLYLYGKLSKPTKSEVM